MNAWTTFWLFLSNPGFRVVWYDLTIMHLRSNNWSVTKRCLWIPSGNPIANCSESRNLGFLHESARTKGASSRYEMGKGGNWSMIHDFHFFLAVKTRESFVPAKHFPKKGNRWIERMTVPAILEFFRGPRPGTKAWLMLGWEEENGQTPEDGIWLC